MRTVIIEDEAHGMKALVAKLKRCAPDVNIIGEFDNAEDGIAGIRELRPDLVFCDVQLGPVNAFDVLGNLSGISFYLIITTGHDEYGIDAIKAGAIDYLLKPISESELKDAVKKVRDQLAQRSEKVPLVAIPVGQTRKMVNLNEIMYVLANNQKTLIKLVGDRYNTVECNRLLWEVEEKLSSFGFFRIHRSHLINPVHVDSYSSAEGGYVIMKDGEQLNIGREYDFPFFLSL